MAEFDVFDDNGDLDREKLQRTQSAAQELLDRADEARGIDPSTRDQTVTITDDSVGVTSARPLFADPESGAKVNFDDGSLTATTADDGVSVRGRFSSATADSGDLLGPVKISAHGPEAEGFATSNNNRTGQGGHLDVVGIDAQVGDEGTHIKAGASFGVGFGLEVITGEDADGDGRAEFGIKGELGTFSGEAKFEEDDAVNLANSASTFATETAEEFGSAIADPGASVERQLNDAQTVVVGIATDASQFSVPDAAERIVTAGSELMDDDPLNPTGITLDSATASVQEVATDTSTAAQSFVDATLDLAGAAIPESPSAFDSAVASVSEPTFSADELTSNELSFDDSQTSSGGTFDD